MPPSFDSLIHAVLDGEASAAQRAELDRRMETDPALRAKFEAMQRVFTMLEAVPAVDPPAGLVESILARATLRAGRRELSHQPFAGANVIAAYPGDARVIRPRRSTRGNWFSVLVHFLKEIGMNDSKPGFLGTNKGKLLVTAGVAAVALFGISTVIDFPIDGTSTTGTIVPAERYRAPQNAAEDIKVGLPSATSNAPGQAAGVAATNVNATADALIRNNPEVKANVLMQNNAEVKADVLMQNNAEVKANVLMQNNAEVKTNALMQNKANVLMQNNAEVKTNALMQNNAEVKANALMQNNAELKVGVKAD